MIINDLNHIEVVSETSDIQGGRNSASAIALAGAVAIGPNSYTAAGTTTTTVVVHQGGSLSGSGSISYATTRGNRR